MLSSMKNLALIGFLAFLTGCAAPGYYGYPSRGALNGTALGAVGGALLGYATDGGHGNGALMGGALGAVAGGFIGQSMTHRHHDHDKHHGHPRSYNPPHYPRQSYDYHQQPYHHNPGDRQGYDHHHHHHHH